MLFYCIHLLLFDRFVFLLNKRSHDVRSIFSVNIWKICRSMHNCSHSYIDMQRYDEEYNWLCASDVHLYVCLVVVESFYIAHRQKGVALGGLWGMFSSLSDTYSMRTQTFERNLIFSAHLYQNKLKFVLTNSSVISKSIIIVRTFVYAQIHHHHNHHCNSHMFEHIHMYVCHII